jgi:hypothetical protein
VGLAMLQDDITGFSFREGVSKGSQRRADIQGISVWFHFVQSKCMDQSLSIEANSSSDNQEITRLRRIPKAHYRVHSSQSLYTILTRRIQTTSLHPISFTFILIASSHLRLGLWSGFLSQFSTNFCVHFSYPPSSLVLSPQ